MTCASGDVESSATQKGGCSPNDLNADGTPKAPYWCCKVSCSNISSVRADKASSGWSARVKATASSTIPTSCSDLKATYKMECGPSMTCNNGTSCKVTFEGTVTIVKGSSEGYSDWHTITLPTCCMRGSEPIGTIECAIGVWNQI